MRTFLILLFPCLLSVAAPIKDGDGQQRAKELKSFIQKEKSAYQARETVKKNLLEEMDKLNAEQNEIRRHIETITQNHQEMSMALENLALEHARQKELAAFEKKRLWLLYKVVYKLKKEGVVRFLFPGSHASGTEGLSKRLRVLFRTLKSRVHLAKQLEERVKRLHASEQRLAEARERNVRMLAEMEEQEELLKELQKKKKSMLSSVNRQQDSYQAAVKEYKNISKQLAALFDNFESVRDSSPENSLFPKRGTLPTPLDLGHVVKNFGKSVNERFGTVTYYKGLEIQADMNAPVRAIMPGTVEFEGWVKGLGNVVIIHHGSGFYSLSGHLYKATKPQGSKVEQGEIVGLVGDTGNSEIPSLYFELRENSRAVDPLVYFQPNELKKIN